MYLVAVNIIGKNNNIIMLSMILFTICPSIINSSNIHTTQKMNVKTQVVQILLIIFLSISISFPLNPYLLTKDFFDFSP